MTEDRTEQRLLTEDGIAAAMLFGSTEDEFAAKLPEACTWVRHLPRPRDLAAECADALDVNALTAVLTYWRHAAQECADGGAPFDTVAQSAVSVPGPGPDPVGFTVDFEAEALYVNLGSAERPVYQTVEITPWLLVDYDADGKPVGVEMLTLTPGKALQQET